MRNYELRLHVIVINNLSSKSFDPTLCTGFSHWIIIVDIDNTTIHTFVSETFSCTRTTQYHGSTFVFIFKTNILIIIFTTAHTLFFFMTK
jgi:hypothetical protein